MNLEPILTYNMNKKEAACFKIGLIWMYLTKKYFPENMSTGSYPKKGDPRKSILFKMCWKLYTETQGLIPFEDYKFYIRAQIDIIKTNSTTPMINPSCLVGDKAWMRWKVWKKFHQSQTVSKQEVQKTPEHVIKNELKSTKKFLFGKFDGQPTEEHIMMAQRDLIRWLAIGKISPFYLILSPWVKKNCEINSETLDLHKNSISDEIEEFFKKTFDYEY